MVVSVQTFGNRAGNYNPHCHCLVSDGVFLSNDTFVRSSFLPPVDITELFRREVLRAFLERELITESVAANMLSWPHSGFHAHLGPVISGDEGEQLKQTARYGARAPLALSRLVYDRDKEPDPWEQSTRYYGWFANRSRGKRKREHGDREIAGEPDGVRGVPSY